MVGFVRKTPVVSAVGVAKVSEICGQIYDGWQAKVSDRICLMTGCERVLLSLV
jgi:hypothetical protein